MTESIQLRRSEPQVKQIIAATYPEYRGRKISLRVGVDMLPGHTWCDGGSWYEYHGYRLSDGATWDLPAVMRKPREYGGEPFGCSDQQRVPVPVGVVVVERVYFCGSDLGLRFYVHPESAAPMLSAKESAEEC